MLSSVLITCRHRGVVDACSLALAKFCACLTKNEPLHEEICKHLLDLVFNSLSDASSTSVTRRSAGFPLLFQAVVSSEENNINRKLLSYAVYKIVDLIYQPLPPSDSINEKTDLPQVHAYHILKALVMDSSLSQAILTHLDCIIPACVSGFSSSLWAVRNGALQLFGVLLPRMCGQKKVRDEDSEHNLVSASELFSRCPALKAYLLQQLKMCVSLHKKKKLCSELMPILSLIVKLSPQQDEMK
ncbi:thyroid adenoma-associated protein homolog [Stegodyphus dumicola]|uniref:thyroid adenoma-associated protein homolog n=1 Tax=Stegodyphus dumicola TaxID=202533 RepID=UPI0015A88036|nr:thyroid adenoma-associated protein homolog [Stegodyphus dumicola]